VRIATFNMESLDIGPDEKVPFEARIAALRPILDRLAADIVCLQG
jgi:hypothetical protein